MGYTNPMRKALLGLAAVVALVVLLLWIRGGRRARPPVPDARAGAAADARIPPRARPWLEGPATPRPLAEDEAVVETPGGEAPIGVPDCDAYIRMFRCFLKAAPEARRRTAADAFHTAVVALRLGVMEATSPKERKRFLKSCAQMHATFRRVLAHYGYAKHCLEPVP